MRILIILNTDASLQTGVVPEYEGLTGAYYLFSDAGAEVVIAAEGGGSATEADRFVPGTEAASPIRRFAGDRQARELMNDLVDLAVVCAEDFDAALCLDSRTFGRQPNMKGQADSLIGKLLAAAKPVAVISAHSTLADAKDGLLMIGHTTRAPLLAAHALLGAIGAH